MAESNTNPPHFVKESTDQIVQADGKLGWFKDQIVACFTEAFGTVNCSFKGMQPYICVGQLWQRHAVY